MSRAPLRPKRRENGSHFPDIARLIRELAEKPEDKDAGLCAPPRLAGPRADAGTCRLAESTKPIPQRSGGPSRGAGQHPASRRTPFGALLGGSCRPARPTTRLVLSIMFSMGRIGSVARAAVFRPERSWRIPCGLARGLRIEIDSRASLHTYLGTSEAELAPHVRRLACRGLRCFDVGAHSGYYALVLARLTGAQVLCFEFKADIVARLRRNLALNPTLAAQVSVLETYVAHEVVAAPRADTLDHLIATGLAFVPDLIKVDVEGAEASVLSGARDLLVHHQPHIILETHSVSLEATCIELLTTAGYAPEIVDQRWWLREHRGKAHNRWIIATGRNGALPAAHTLGEQSTERPA